VARCVHPSIHMHRKTGNSTNHETDLVVSSYEVVVINTENLFRVLQLEVSTCYVQILFIFLSSGCATRGKDTVFQLRDNNSLRKILL
jgi:hypothetical protein